VHFTPGAAELDRPALGHTAAMNLMLAADDTRFG
jgi:hypothetical protein